MNASHPTRARRVSRPAQKPPAARALGQGVSSAAGQRAAVILECLAGERTPRQAAETLAMTVNNFYLLERKALRGLLRACEPQPKGRSGPDPERRLQLLQRELARCQRECQRQAALVRATQQAVGLPTVPPADKKPAQKGTRRRRAERRALRAAKVLRRNALGKEAPPALEPSPEIVTEAAKNTGSQQETEHATTG